MGATMRFRLANATTAVIATASLATCAIVMTAPAFAADDPVTFRGSLSWLTSYAHTEPLDSALNPDNQALLIPEHRGTTELRPNLKLTTSALQLIARPRIRVQFEEVTVGDEKQPSNGSIKDEINEAYLQWTVSDAVTFAYGRQSYQWGAAESLSPSNRIFHETAQSKNVLYDVRGRDMARVNFSVGKSFSTVVMAEVEENEDQGTFVAEQEFKTSGLIKPEFSWNNGADYIGLVGGAREKSRGWIGQYFNISLPIPDGLSLYGDASQQRGSDSWYPVATTTMTPAGPVDVISFERNQIDDEKVRTLAVGGLRYDFEGGTVIRAEHIWNDAAYDEEERELALKAFKTENPLQLAEFETNARRFLTPGLEVPGRRFAFVSIYAPDLFNFKDLTLYLRGMRSVTDGSTEGYGSIEYKVGDAGTIMVAGSGTSGDEDDELRGYASPTQILAYRHDW